MEAATNSVIERFPIRRRYTIPCFAKQCTRTVSRDNGYDNWGYMEEAFADDVRIMTSVPLNSLEYTSLRAFTPMRYFSHRFPPRCVQNGSSWNSATRRKRGLISSGCKISKERFHGKWPISGLHKKMNILGGIMKKQLHHEIVIVSRYTRCRGESVNSTRELREDY